MKLDSFLKPFRGRDDNFQTIWSKFLVLADANGWDTDEKKMSKLPLLLDGAAYTVVDQLPSADKKKPDKVKAALETAFFPSPAEAYHLFVARRVLLDEPVDSYVADLQRLLTLSQHRVADNGKDPVLIEQFLSGLPAEIGKTLRLAHAADEHTISQLVSKARTMQASNGVARAAAATTAMLCYNCNQVGHLRRNCPRLKRGDGQGGNDGSDKRSGGGTSVRCFKCGKVGVGLLVSVPFGDKTYGKMRELPAFLHSMIIYDIVISMATEPRRGVGDRCDRNFEARIKEVRVYVLF